MKHQINTSNYEAYFLDYFEGELSKLQMEDVLSFVALHPHLQEEFDAFALININDGSKVVFDMKDKLKHQTITNYNYKTFLVAWLEGDLSKDEIQQIEKYLTANPSAKPEFEILKQVRLLPDYRIIFENKTGIKKQNKIFALHTWQLGIASIAACIALIFVFYYLLFDKKSNQKNNVAQSKDILLDKKDTIIVENKNQQLPNGQPPLVNSAHIKLKKEWNTKVEYQDKKYQNRKTAVKKLDEPIEKINNLVQIEFLNNDSLLIKKNTASLNEIKNKADIQKSGQIKNYSAESLSDIFNEKDLKDLKELQTNSEVSAKNNFWRIAEKSAAHINAASGSNIIVENTNTMNIIQMNVLQIGTFGFSKSKAK